MGTLSEGEDGREQIVLEFSEDYGESYYTYGKECPDSYVALKVHDDEMRLARTRALAVIDEDNKSIHQGQRSLLIFTIGIVIPFIINGVLLCVDYC